MNELILTDITDRPSSSIINSDWSKIYAITGTGSLEKTRLMILCANIDHTNGILTSPFTPLDKLKKCIYDSVGSLVDGMVDPAVIELLIQLTKPKRK